MLHDYRTIPRFVLEPYVYATLDLFFPLHFLGIPFPPFACICIHIWQHSLKFRNGLCFHSDNFIQSLGFKTFICHVYDQLINVTKGSKSSSLSKQFQTVTLCCEWDQVSAQTVHLREAEATFYTVFKQADS